MQPSLRREGCSSNIINIKPPNYIWYTLQDWKTVPDGVQQCLYWAGEGGVSARAEGGLSDHHRQSAHWTLPGPAERSVWGGKIQLNIPSLYLQSPDIKHFPLATPPLEFPIYFTRLQVPPKRDVLWENVRLIPYKMFKVFSIKTNVKSLPLEITSLRSSPK